MLNRWMLATISFALMAASGANDVEAASEAECQALQSQDFSHVIDASTHLMATGTVAAANDVPAYCQVKGYVSSSVEFELRLPMEDLNGKFVKRGCGGFCGSVFIDACDNHVKDGYACIASDMGHTSTALDAKWAYNDLQAEIDFGYRATHVVTVAGKAITEAFYSNAPQRSYFMGCSTGGRQGLVEAQRFPYDFDGIVAGAQPSRFDRLIAARGIQRSWLRLDTELMETLATGMTVPILTDDYAPVERLLANYCSLRFLATIGINIGRPEACGERRS